MVRVLMLGVNYNAEPAKDRLCSSVRSLVELQKCLNEVPRFSYPPEYFKFLVEDEAEEIVVRTTSHCCEDVEIYYTAEDVLHQIREMVSHATPGEALLFVYCGHGGIDKDGISFMDLGIPAHGEEPRVISATTFRETVLEVLPPGVTLYPMFDCCCGGGFKMQIPIQYPRFHSFRNNPDPIIVITSSHTNEGKAYDDFWQQETEVSCTQFMFCLIWVIRNTTGMLTNLKLVEKVDQKLESIEKLRKRLRGPGTKEQHPSLFCSKDQSRLMCFS